MPSQPLLRLSRPPNRRHASAVRRIQRSAVASSHTVSAETPRTRISRMHRHTGPAARRPRSFAVSAISSPVAALIQSCARRQSAVVLNHQPSRLRAVQKRPTLLSSSPPPCCYSSHRAAIVIVIVVETLIPAAAAEEHLTAEIAPLQDIVPWGVSRGVCYIKPCESRLVNSSYSEEGC